ncbi:hypothetical protein KH5_05810 [Urechidicola sp. KH5]
MNTIFNLKKVIAVAAFLIGATSYSQMGVGTTSPNSNAMLDIESTSKGLLPPRMTTAQRIAISPVGTGNSGDNGLLVYDTDENAYYFWNGSSWLVLGETERSVGNIYLTSPVSNFNIGYSSTLINGVTTMVNSTNFDSPSNGRLRYTGASTKVFNITATISFKRNSSSSGAEETFSFGLGINGGAVVAATSSSVKFDDNTSTIGFPGVKNNDSKLVTIVGTVSLAQNDYIELFASNANGTNIDIDTIQIVVD